MNRRECEKAILVKCKEILDIYHEYVPDGEELEISFHRTTNGNDYGDWPEQLITVTNNTFQAKMPDGSYGAYEAHKPLDLRHQMPFEDDEDYQSCKRMWDADNGDGDWERLEKEEEEYFQIPERGVIGSDQHGYAYDDFCTKYHITPVYSRIENNRRLLMIEDMDVFKENTTKENDGMEKWKQEHEEPKPRKHREHRNIG